MFLQHLQLMKDEIKYQKTHPRIPGQKEVILSFCLLQGELFVGDQSGAIHIWDLKTDHNEQLVSGSVW